MVEEWKDCEELKPKSREKWIFVNKKGKEASDGVVCDTEEVSVYEMRKEQQEHEDARKCGGPKWLVEDSKHHKESWGKSQCGGHDRVDGEALIWCRKCSGYVRR